MTHQARTGGSRPARRQTATTATATTGGRPGAAAHRTRSGQAPARTPAARPQEGPHDPTRHLANGAA